MKFEFKDFLLNEDKAYLGQQIGNILSATQDLVQNSKGMGTRQLVRSSETIVNQMRRILHTHWPQQHEDDLKRLQKAAVAIAKSIEDKDSLEEILQGAAQELEGLMGDMDSPVNQLGSPPEQDQPKEEPTEPTGEPQGEAPQTPPEAAPAAPMAPQAPGMAPGAPAPGMAPAAPMGAGMPPAAPGMGMM
jgi:hypothetical protein